MGIIYLLPEDLVQLHSLPVFPSPYAANVLLSPFWIRTIFSMYLILTLFTAVLGDILCVHFISCTIFCFAQNL